MQEQEQNQLLHIQGNLPDTSIPPPPLPPTYMTFLYPAYTPYTDKLFIKSVYKVYNFDINV